jgi:hypothetical protein
MGNQFRVEVRESSEQLQHRLRHAVTAAATSLIVFERAINHSNCQRRASMGLVAER